MSRETDALLAEEARRAVVGLNGRQHASVAPSNDVRPSTARTLREWLENATLLQPPPIVYPQIVHAGRASLLSGREKIGKTTLIAGAVAAASRGDPVLDAALVAPITTLWYAIDEPVGDAVRRFNVLGANPDRIMINDEPRTVADVLVALKRDVEAFPDVLGIVVDTLSRAFASSGIDPNSSREVEPLLAKLVDFIHRQKAGAVLLYHTGKAGREYRGSTAIGATVDDILTLRRRGQAEEDDFDDDTTDDGRRLLVQEGRNLRGRLQLTCVSGLYRLFDDAYPPRERILEALFEHGSASSRTELVKLASVQKKRGLSAIAELIVEGAIIEKGTGKLVAGAVPVRGSASVPRYGNRPELTEPATPTASGSHFRNPPRTETGTDTDPRPKGSAVL